MLNSSTFCNNNNSSPVLHVDSRLSYFTLTDDSNQNSKQEDYQANNYYSTSYYHFPSPLFYNEIDDFVINHDLDIMQQSSLANNSSILIHDSSVMEVDHNKVDASDKADEISGVIEDNSEMMDRTFRSTKTSNLGGLMKRASNKERHSKIRTAHGLRDRRMRLSLQVARPFFELQDLLGFDKASRTVEWLLMQSNSAIEELLLSKHGSPSGVTKCTLSSTSDDCEVESTIVVEELNGHPKEERGSRYVKKDERKTKKTKRTKEERKVVRERAKKKALERRQSTRVVNNEGGLDFAVIRDNHHVLNDTDGISGSWSHLPTLSLQQTFEGCQSVPSYTISTPTVTKAAANGQTIKWCF